MKTISKSIRIDPEVYQSAKVMAAKLNLYVGRFIETAILEYKENHKELK